MSTRGALGFRINGVDKISYNHYDSYPSCLGQRICDTLRASMNWDDIRRLAVALRVVSNSSVPSESDRIALDRYYEADVGDESIADWYCLLRKTHGKILDILEAGVLVDYAFFLTNSLFCEWGYIINLDSDMLEVYEGFQHKQHNLGRYSDLESTSNNSDYFPCALVKTFPLVELPVDIESELLTPE